MFISWNWLHEYLPLGVTPELLAERVMMAGLNHEATNKVGDDLQIHLEVTSNRSDCLGHIGVAREAAVLLGQPLKFSPAEVQGKGAAIESGLSLAIDAPSFCPRYTARLIRGVKIGPSPAWLVNRLATVGIAAINNVVDITNYVLMECGQPLHAFDYAKLQGKKLVVRAARSQESFEAINHKTYTLDPSIHVIADGGRAVAIAGVMGGADTEVSSATRDVVIESAAFDAVSVRQTARKLVLHSESSYRFERPLDPAGVDWASRRCCELILELAGGELASGSLDQGAAPQPRPPITLRLAQIKRILGIEVPRDAVAKILKALGNQIESQDDRQIVVSAPSWRADLTREIDLIEEVARIHGYDKIPEDVHVPMAKSHRLDSDRVSSQVRQTLAAMGFNEAMTLSAVDAAWSEAFSPWTDRPALQSATPILRRANQLRRSLIPSLLGARQINESLSNPVIELFEIASIYTAAATSEDLPGEDLLLGLCSGGEFLQLKGAIESLLARLNRQARLSVEPLEHALFQLGQGVSLKVTWGERTVPLGFLGAVSPAGLQQFELRQKATVAELRMSVLEELAVLVPQYQMPPIFPAVARDLNLVVEETLNWEQLAATVRRSGGPALESLDYRGIWRDAEKLGPGKKSLLVSILLRSSAGTLTSEQADQLRDQIVAACAQSHGAELRR